MKNWFIVLITLLVVFSGTAYAQALGVTIDPVSGTHSVALGDSFTFTATASGGTGPYTYKWAKDSPTGYITGATNSSYTIAVAEVASAGAYYAVVTDTIPATVTSGAITMTVLRATTSPASGTHSYAFGGTFTLTTTAVSGVSPYTYAWALDGTPIGAATNSTYTVAVTDNDDVGAYTVAVTDSDTSTYTTVAIDILIMSIVTDPVSETYSYALGDTFTFTVTPTGGVSPYTYKWAKDSPTGYITGATNSAYTIAVLDAEDVGTYYAEVTDSHATRITAAPITALIMEITTSPVSGTIEYVSGSSWTFTVTATGGEGPYTYQWAKDGTNISNATNSSYTNAVVAASEAGDYTVVVNDALSTEMESVAIEAAVSVSESITANQVTPVGINLATGTTSIYETTTYTLTNINDPAFLYVYVQTNPIILNFVWNTSTRVTKKLKFENYQVPLAAGRWVVGPLPLELISNDGTVVFTKTSLGGDTTVVTPIITK